jgi:hypothetical protein
VSACEKCVELIGKPPSVDPHAGLKQLSGRKLPNAWQEYYLCGVCGTTLKRIVPFPGVEDRFGEAWSEVRKGESGKLTESRRHMVSGTYTTKRKRVNNNGLLIWDSEVKRAGDWKGNPGGHILLPDNADVPLTVKQLVGTAIEELVDVQK